MARREPGPAFLQNNFEFMNENKDCVPAGKFAPALR